MIPRTLVLLLIGAACADADPPVPWVRSPLQTDTVRWAGCGSATADVVAFVQGTRPGEPRVRVVACRERDGFALFHAAAADALPVFGVAYGDRVGWLGLPPGEGGFGFRPGDGLAYERELVAMLARVAGNPWIETVVGHHEVPGAGRDALVDLAARSRDLELGRLLLSYPAVSAHDRPLAALLELEWRLAGGPRVPAVTLERLWSAAPRLAADPTTTEVVLYLVARQLPGPTGGKGPPRYEPLPVARALAASPRARESARIQHRLVTYQGSGADELRREAAFRLLALPGASAGERRDAVAVLRRDPGAAERLLSSRTVRGDPALLAMLAAEEVAPRVRYAALDAVLADPDAGPEAIAELTWLLRWPEYRRYREAILSHPGVRHAPLLAAIAREARGEWSAPRGERLRTRAEALVEPILADPATRERELYLTAVEIQHSEASRIAEMLLRNPRVRRCAPILEHLAEMLPFTYPPGHPALPAPSGESIRLRAAALLRGLEGGGAAPVCLVGPRSPH